MKTSFQYLLAAVAISTGLFSTKTSADEPPDGPLRWVTVSGTARTAESNRGYLVTSDTNTVITLPANPHVGSIVRLTGVGTGEWAAATNKGQSVGSNIAATFSSLEANAAVTSLASSYNGTHIIAGTSDGPSISNDAGLVWTPVGAAVGLYVASVASSYSGNLLLANWGRSGLFESTNDGATWASEFPNLIFYMDGILSGPVACSADGAEIAYLDVGQNVATIGPIATSITASGGSSPTLVAWACLASSSSGSVLIAAVGQGAGSGIITSGAANQVTATGQIYTTTNYGATWTPSGPTETWTSVATSADGTKMYAVGSGTPIYTSTNSAGTWVPEGPAANWTSVSCSADGSLVAAAAGGVVYTSVNYGVTWAAGGISGTVVCVSPDGTKLIVGNGNEISTQAFPDASGKPSTTFSAVVGTQYSSAELIYVGGGRWQLLSHEEPISFQ